MKCIVPLVCLLAASPAFSQTRTYTNADLGQPVSSTRVTPAEAAAILAPHQFQLPAPLAVGPQVLGLPSSVTGGPFGEFPDFAPARRLDGTLLSQPAQRYSTFIPYYGGWRGGHVDGTSRGGAGTHRAATSTGREGRSRR